MDTPKPGWTPYVVYTTEILSFLYNRNIISNGKISFKIKLVYASIADHLLHSSYPYLLGEQGWRSGESARLPPMWPGFDSRSRRHMWVEFVVGSRPCSERFFSGYSGFPLSSKTNISKFQFDLESVPN